MFVGQEDPSDTVLFDVVFVAVRGSVPTDDTIPRTPYAPASKLDSFDGVSQAPDHSDALLFVVAHSASS
jgi:hypothetical protein